MPSPAVPFRLDAAHRAGQLRQFNARSEIAWFGFAAAFEEPGMAVVTFAKLDAGALVWQDDPAGTPMAIAGAMVAPAQP